MVLANNMTLTYILLATLLGSILSLVGGLFLLSKKKFSEELSTKLVSFSAGVLLATAFTDLFPEALHEAGENDIFMPALAAIVLFFFLERFLFWFHHHHHTHGMKPSLMLIVVGDTVHNFIDGVAIAASFLVSIPLGITTTIAVIAHEVPQEIADFSLFISQGISKKRTILINLISATAAVVGAIITYYFSEQIEGSLYAIIAFTAGMFTYIAAADLIPELHKDFHKQRNWPQTLYFVGGIAIVIILGSIIGEYGH